MWAQEARGLDAGPRVAERLRGLGDLRSAAIVTRIAEEELAHVAVGVDWFLRLCTQTGQAPGEAFQGKGMSLNPEEDEALKL